MVKIMEEPNRNNDKIWHPYTQMKMAPMPIHIERANGTILYGKDGKEYIDAISSWWVNLHGHAHPFIAGKIAEQAMVLEQVIFAGFTHTPAIELAENLIRVLPEGFAKIFFSDNGSTAVEVAIKMALQYYQNIGATNKTRIIAFENAYHGDTFGAMSVGAKSAFNSAFQDHLFEVHHLPVPDDKNIESVKSQLLSFINEGNIAAFIFEPLVQGAGGMLMHKAEHLDELLNILKQKNIICIADEVMTGFGRTGKTFASEYLEQQADIICLSKGITGGFMPLGVTACSQKIYDAFYSGDVNKTFYHGHSYTANPLACAAANASLQLLMGEDCRRQINWIAESHRHFALSLTDEPFIKEIRQQGTIVAIELNTKEDSSYFNSVRHDVSEFCLSQGVLLRPLGNVIYLMPPYCITKNEIEKVYEVIKRLIVKLKFKYY